MKKKIIAVMLSLILFCGTTPVLIFANDNNIAVTISGISNAQTYSNNTGYRYKIVNGKLYQRLWSYTYSRWEEPCWTLVE